MGHPRPSTRSVKELQSKQIAEPYRKGGPQRVTAPYAKSVCLLGLLPSSAGSVKAGVNLRGPPRKAKYVSATDSELVP